MLNSLLRTTALATSLILAGGTLTSAALAEVVFNRGSAADPESLDPHKTSTVYEADILRDMFVGLVTEDAKSGVIPGAAESWTVSDDGKTYTFKLRNGATWSDGSPVTADDFVYSWRRLQDPATGSEYAFMLYVVQGAEEINTGKAAPDTLAVKAVDANTLEVQLKAATPYFLEMLTHQVTYAISKANVEKFGEEWSKPGKMVTNGPYALAEFIPNDRVKLVKNAKFYDADNVKIDVVNYIPNEDRSAAMKRFEAGEIDSYADLPTEQLAELKSKFGEQIRVGPYLGTYYFAIKADKAPWDNPKIRNAISMAIDRDFLAEKVWSNSMLPAYSMVPPGINGYTSSMASYAEKSQIDREDDAKAILTELGYGPDKPLKLEIRYNTSENHKNTVVAIQEQLRPLGVEVTLLNTDAKTHYDFLDNKGDFDLARAAWIADYNDPETFLGISVTGAGKNYSSYHSATFDGLMKQAAGASADPAKRFDLLSQAERVLIDDVGNIPVLYYSFKNAVSTKITGWDDNVMDRHPTRFMTKAE